MKPRHDKLGGCRVGAVPPDAKHRKIGAKTSLPPKVDLRPYLTSIESQVGMSCVANTCAGAYEYLAKRNLGDSDDVSRLFIYYNARYEEGGALEDAGTTMLSAINGLKKYGACREDLWPNDIDYINDEPDSGAYEHAAKFKITEAEYVETNLDLWRHTLADGYPIAFCLNTFSSFDDATHNRGRVPIPKKTEQEREEHGWHAMLCVGYLDKDEMFIVRNSWGEEWGDKGYCYIPYHYVIHNDLNGHDSWVVKSLQDTDFSQGIESEEDDSYFAEEGSIQLFDFYVATAETDEFATELESLCDEYATDEEYYFDYEETEEDGVTYIEISNFDISLDDPEGFLQALDELCNEWAEDEDYDFSVEGYDEEDNEESDNTEEESDYSLTLSGFYIYTEEGEKVAARIEKLCAKHTTESEAYNYEWEEDEDDDGTYISFTVFELTPDDEDGFLTALEALCEKVCDDGGYDWD